MRYRGSINGLPVDADYDDESVQNLFIPFLRKAASLLHDRRVIVFLAAPPGAGKSTLAAFLEHLSRTETGLTPVQALGMDGFHHTNAWLIAHGLRSVKGAPESFDSDLFLQKLNAAKAGECLWPYYDRRIHDPVPDAIPVREDILLIEGNWLLLDEPFWPRLECDYSLFLHAGPALLKDRLIGRKMAGDASREAAETWYQQTDLPNVMRCLAHSRKADQTLETVGTGVFRTR